MKRIDMFCASQASTAICMSKDQPSSSSSSSIQLGGRAIDRHNPIIRDHRRTSRTLPFAPCTSQSPPINPQPHPNFFQNPKKSSTKLHHKNHNKTSSNDVNKDNKSSSKLIIREDFVVKKSWANKAEAAELMTTPGSSRYLLSDHKDFSVDAFSDHYDSVLALVPSKSTYQSHSSSTSSNDSCHPPSNQVVVLRVSLHCRGCEGKVRKHLSRMQGVRSFNIDFAAKKVTIVGNVTPLGVLASISKVKSAQFWTSPTSAPSPSPSPSPSL